MIQTSLSEAVCLRIVTATFPGAQTERRGGAGPVRGLLGSKDPTGRSPHSPSRSQVGPPHRVNAGRTGG
jgi:hypothetical protein